MALTDIGAVTTTSLSTAVSNFNVSPESASESQGEETIFYNADFEKYFGYYRKIPELKKAIDTLVMWTCGLGWSCADPLTKVHLDHMSGNGKDTFDTLMQNALIVKKLNGKSYAEKIMKDGVLINLKPLNPSRMRDIANSKGMLIRYEEFDINTRKAIRTFKPDELFVLINDRVVNEIEGVSVIESCQWVIDARNEAMADKRRAMHRSMIRVIEVDSDDTQRLATLKVQWAEAIKKGEVMIFPKGTMAFPDVPPMSTAEHSEWIRYLEGFFYLAVGVSEVAMGGSAQFNEASSKMGHLSFEQPHMTERRQLEQQIVKQLNMEIDFDAPTSIKGDVQDSENANTGQIGIQPNDTTAGVGA